MTRTWLIDVRGFAVKVKNPTCSSSHITNGANRECPNCHYQIDNSDVSIEWPGLPAGVKFDPSDAEILDHLAAKCGVGNSEPHLFIDEFIPSLEGGQGICYTHPENLPGAKKDGSSAHFFHRTTNAYATGQRKRRKIQSQSTSTEHVRWHKTGKTKQVVENGVHKGCKKIMVLYRSSNKGSKPEKSNWVMHQYHLGSDEDEKDGEYVVSKIFYQQQKQTDENVSNPVIEDPDILALRTSPTTPKSSPPNPPRPNDDDMSPISAQESKLVTQELHAAPAVQHGDDLECTEWLAGESQNVDEYNLDFGNDSLLCKEILDSSNNSGFSNVSGTVFVGNSNDQSLENKPYGIAELANLELDTPPDFLAELQFDSQDGILGWLDRL